ncbi:DUF2179 domain-containing protein [archaeon]|nr:DUF2179 domain-containing protein [archaeon]
MDFQGILNSDFYAWVFLPLAIFLARVCDVSLGTVRIILILRGIKLATLIGFFEILVWLLAIGHIMQNLTNFGYYIAYAGGFATGTYVGILIENKLSLGVVIVRIITKRDATELIKHLKEQNYGVTTVDAQGVPGPVKIILMVVNRHDIDDVAGIIKRFNPHAFYSVEDVRFTREGIFPPKRDWINGKYWKYPIKSIKIPKIKIGWVNGKYWKYARFRRKGK